MRHRIAATASWSLALLVGLTASAQTGNSSDQSKGQQGGSQASKDQDKSQSKDSNQSQGQSQTIHGELAGVSVVGETMVDYSSGRGVVAELTYLTILGSSSDAHSGSGGQANSSGGSGQGSKDQASSGSQNEGDRSNKDQADKGHGSNDQSGGSSAHHRRTVYQIAVGPETRVSDRTAKDSGDQKGSARERSQAAMDRLQLGDRVEVEFARMTGSDQQNSGANNNNNNGGSSNQTRHGRHRIVRGVATSVTILSAPDQGGDHGGGDQSKGNDSSSGSKSSGSGSQDKSSGEKK